jgi:hypothetical protein
LKVFTDGLRIEIISSKLLRGRACGLCGDMNGEKTADLMTPEQCYTKNSKLVGYSYMLDKEGPKCSGIPSEDREEYEREIRKCVKVSKL